jgi:hypothetical protein
VVGELAELGWDDAWSVVFAPFLEHELTPGRVAIQHRGAYDVLTAEGEVRARITAHLRRRDSAVDLPVVGDWVALDQAGAIVGVLPRRTKLSRRAAHDAGSDDLREQVIAANLDIVFVTASLGEEVDSRLLERYCVSSRVGRAVILLTKADLRIRRRRSRGCGMDGEIPAPGLAHARLPAWHHPAPDGCPSRLLGRRQVDARQRSGRTRRSARDRGCAP